MDWQSLLELPWWKITSTTVPIALSCISLGLVLHDRRPRLRIQGRKGLWYLLQEVSTVRGRELKFSGVIEIYNSSSRANTIRSYTLFYKDNDGGWIQMESERYEDGEPDHTGPFIYNSTPLTVAPYSGIEWRVMSFIIQPRERPKSLQVRIEIEDLFGKISSVEVTAYS
jgi:hypothetical protein